LTIKTLVDNFRFTYFIYHKCSLNLNNLHFILTVSQVLLAGNGT